MSRPHATVVVCTRNRSASLAESCAALLAIDNPGGGWELLIVDNDSTDDTLQVADGVARSRPELVRVVVEAEVGLSAARNRGVREARGEIIAFLDDDAFPAPGWLCSLAAALREDQVLAAGGPVEPAFEGELPAWFSDRYLPYLTVWDRGPDPQPLTYNEYPRGANISFRREVFERFGPFSAHLGRKGSSLLSCEEIELCLRIERAGGKILYVPQARIRHLTPTGRITPSWLTHRFAAQGRSEAIVDWRHAGLRGLRRGLLRFLKNALAASRQEEDERRAEIFARCQRAALRGYLRGLLTAPVRVPRYRPSPAAGPAAAWLPFA